MWCDCHNLDTDDLVCESEVKPAAAGFYEMPDFTLQMMPSLDLGYTSGVHQQQ